MAFSVDESRLDSDQANPRPESSPACRSNSADRSEMIGIWAKLSKSCWTCSVQVVEPPRTRFPSKSLRATLCAIKLEANGQLRLICVEAGIERR